MGACESERLISDMLVSPSEIKMPPTLSDGGGRVKGHGLQRGTTEKTFARGAEDRLNVLHNKRDEKVGISFSSRL